MSLLILPLNLPNIDIKKYATVSNRSVLMCCHFSCLLQPFEKEEWYLRLLLGCHFSSLPYEEQFQSDCQIKTSQGETITPCSEEWMLWEDGCCWSLSDPHPAQPGALAWRFIEMEAATELLVRSRIKPYRLLQPVHSTSAGLCDLQPWQTWACRCRGWRSQKGLPDWLLWGQERLSLIFNVLSSL